MLSTKRTVACTQARPAVACPPRASTIARAQPEKVVLPAIAAIMLAIAPPAFADSGLKATVNAISEGTSNLKDVKGNVELLGKKENEGVRGATELYNQADSSYYNRRFGGDNARLFDKGAAARRKYVDITSPTPDKYHPADWFRLPAKNVQN